MPGGGSIAYTWCRTDQHGLPILESLTNANGTSYLTHDDTGSPLALRTYTGTLNYGTAPAPVDSTSVGVRPRLRRG